MGKRSRACEFSTKVRKEIHDRDRVCIKCRTTLMLTFAHLISRSQGGLGIKENGVLLCLDCHHELDNGKNRQYYKDFVRNYLERLYPDFTDEERKYDKWK